MTETERDGIQAALIERCNALEAEVERLRAELTERGACQICWHPPHANRHCCAYCKAKQALAAHPEPIADEEG